jgi:hypothetical protein
MKKTSGSHRCGPDVAGVEILPAFQVLEIVAHFIDSLAIGGGVAIGKEMVVPVVGVLNSARVPDGAPVLLGSPCDFHDVCQQPVGIRAVHAIESFNCVQIPQFVPVNRQVISAPRFGYVVHREANGLGRELLARRAGLLPARSRGAFGGLAAGARTLVRRPLRAVASSLLAWLIGLGAAAVAAVAIAAGWTLVQAVYLSAAGADGATALVTAATWLVAALATAVLVAIVGLALSAIGAAAALRSAMLTQSALGGRSLP